MSINLEKRMPVIIKRLDAAREALIELSGFDDKQTQHAGDCRVKLSSDIREMADYLESATWWRKKA